VKHVLRYLRGTVGYGLRYASSIDMRLQGYATQIGQEAQLTERAPSDVASA
jgi:hypothetical protein